MQRTFEPDRLSPAMLVQAYGQIVPPSIRVLPQPIARPEAQGRPDNPKQNQLTSPGSAEMSGRPTQSLVIETITKKEV